MKKQLISIGITILFGAIYYYLALPPLNPTSFAFWSFLVTLIIVYILSSSLSSISDYVISASKNYKTIEQVNNIKTNSLATKIALSLIAFIFLGIVIVNLINAPLFNAEKYANRIIIDETKEFSEDVAAVDFNTLPLLDKESTQKLGDRKMGEIPEMVSQFYVSTLYTQINYNEDIIRVTPLEYDGIIKYFNNRKEGITGYITVNSVDGEATLVTLDEGMKYMSSAFFGEDLDRKLRFSYPTEIFDTKTFEIDEEGNPYWIIPTIKYVGVSMRKEIDGIIILNAVTGESEKYDLDDIPNWVDHVYPSELILEQVNNWGSYVNGFWNSIFTQKNVVNATEGYNYLTIDDDVYLYTGITSVAADESNLGFILVNLRTKETNFYSVAGAEEFSAMNSAQGLVQEKNYVSSFPLLINLNNRPTYLMSLKDAAGLVKMYAFVDVEDYQIVSTTESSMGIETAASEYLAKINNDGSISGNLEEKEITISSITTAIISGDTYYYLTDTEGNKYQASIKVDEYKLPFVYNGMKINIKYHNGDINIIKNIDYLQ